MQHGFHNHITKHQSSTHTQFKNHEKQKLDIWTIQCESASAEKAIAASWAKQSARKQPGMAWRNRLFVKFASLRTRPDISWAVARITRLASSDESRARVCVKHVAQYLKWTLHFALFYEPVTDRKWHCYTDASWSPEGDYSHQAVAIYYDTNLVAWQSQRQSLVALSSAEAELIASVWGNRLALSLYGQLMEMILDKPTYITYCDDAAVVQLTQQLSASKTRTRHLSMRASWLHHLVQREHVSMQFVPTSYQKAHILTKGLQAYTHELAREGLRLRLCNGL